MVKSLSIFRHGKLEKDFADIFTCGEISGRNPIQIVALVGADGTCPDDRCGGRLAKAKGVRYGPPTYRPHNTVEGAEGGTGGGGPSRLPL